MTSGRLATILLLLVAFASPLAHGANGCLGATGAHPAYSVYIVPQRGVLATFRSWARLLQRVGAASGLCFRLEISDNFPDFEHALLAGIPDFVYLNPYHEVMARRAAGYLPLVHDSAYALRGILLVRHNSPLRDVHDLNGGTIAFPAPNAFVASLLVRHHLETVGVHFTPLFVGSHGNAYRAVAVGDAVAAGGANTTFEREPASLRRNLRVLYQTPASMPHPFAAHPRVPLKVREAVIKAMLQTAGDPAGRALLDAVQIPHPVRADYTRDYAPIEALGLERLVQIDGK